MSASVPIRSGHIPHQMDDRVAGADVYIKLVERGATVFFEIRLNLYLDIMACEVAAKLIAVGEKLVRDGRKKYFDGHGSRTLRMAFGLIRDCDDAP